MHSHGQADSQRKSLDKRERKLRRAIWFMAPVANLYKAAEGVRAAKLLLFKAKLELIRCSEDADAKPIKNIERKRDYW
jgi:hypothetical protein